MAARDGDITPGSSHGMATLQQNQALRVFHRLLRHDEAQVAVLPIDWSQWGRRYQEASGSALLNDHLDGPAAAPAVPSAARSSLLPSREELLALPEGERPGALAERLMLAAAATLRAEPSSVGLDRPLVEAGLDSLMAVELRNELEGRIGVSLPISVFLKGASVQALAAELVERLPADDGPAEDAIQRVERFEDVAADLLAQLEEQPDDHAGDESKEPA
jgi:acyl carrier protein